ncbi:TPA: hypothetical protein ACSQ2O_002809 [Klebsiella michiganensis]
MTTDITELAQRMKAAAVRAKAATEDYVAHRMSITVYLEECKEFNDLSDGPDNILALVEALEKAEAQSSKWLEAYHKAVSIGARYEERIAELESRTVTVKLASRRLPSDYVDGEFGNDDLAVIHNACRLECKVSVEKYLSAHGIVVKWEDE